MNIRVTMVQGRFNVGWRALFRASPGLRFQSFYESHVEARRGRWTVIVALTVGLTFVALGLVALVTPGPGLLLLLVGAGLLARESLIVARGLDWTELRVRRLTAWVRVSWCKAPGPWRVIASLLALAFLGALAYGSYALILGV